MLSAALLMSLTAAVPTSSVAVTAPIAERSNSLGTWFAGSAVAFTTSANLQSIAPDQQLTHNPGVTSALVVTPRLNVAKGLAATARFGFSYEWTNSDFTRTEHEPLLLDTTLGVNYLGLPALPWGTRVGLSAGIDLPTSKISQARTMIVSPSASVQAWHVFGGIFGGRVITSASGGYEHPFYRYETPSLVDDLEYAPQCFGGDVSCVDQASGVANASDILSWSLAAVGQWGIVSPGIAFAMSHQFPFDFQDLPGVDRVTDPTTVRVVSTFGVWADVFLPAGVTARVGYTLNRNVIAGDGQIGNLLYDRYQDGQLYLTLRIAPFAEATPLRRQSDDDDDA